MDQPAEDVSPSYLRGRGEHDRLRPFAMRHSQAEPAVGPLAIVVVDVLERAPSPAVCDHR